MKNPVKMTGKKGTTGNLDPLKIIQLIITEKISGRGERDYKNGAIVINYGNGR